MALQEYVQIECAQRGHHEHYRNEFQGLSEMTSHDFPKIEPTVTARPTDMALEDVYCDSSAADDGSRFPSLSYEDGVQAAIKWVLGRGPHPLED